jgi:hypothetical protein
MRSCGSAVDEVGGGGATGGCVMNGVVDPKGVCFARYKIISV